MKKLTLLMILAAICVSSGIAEAAEAQISEFDSAGRAVITGKADSAGTVSISIFGKNMTAADANNMTDGALLYANQIETADGSFSVPIVMSGKETGEYGIAVYKNGAELLADSFYYADSADAETAIEGLNSVIKTGTASDVTAYIAEHKIELGFKSKYDASVSASDISALLSKNAPFDKKDAAGCAAAYKKAALAYAVSGGIVTDIEKAEGDFEILKSGAAAEVYNAAYMTSAAKKLVLPKLKGFAPYSDLADFDAKTAEALVLAVVKAPTGAGDIKTAIQKLYPDFSAKLLEQQILRKVAYNDFPSLENLKQTMQSYADNSSGGSSGSSSGSSSGGAPFTANSSQKTETNERFSDLQSVAWAKDAILSLAEKGVISGKEEKLFCPQDNITREEFVKMLAVMFSMEDENAGEPHFTDVSADAWYAKYVNGAYAAGIVSGRPDGSFGTGEKISRQDAAVMIYKCLGTEETEAEDADFADADEISDYAAAAVRMMKAKGIISGYEDGTFKPYGNLTRAEAAMILYRTEEVKQ